MAFRTRAVTPAVKNTKENPSISQSSPCQPADKTVKVCGPMHNVSALPTIALVGAMFSADTNSVPCNGNSYVPGGTFTLAHVAFVAVTIKLLLPSNEKFKV